MEHGSIGCLDSSGTHLIYLLLFVTFHSTILGCFIRSPHGQRRCQDGHSIDSYSTATKRNHAHGSLSQLEVAQESLLEGQASAGIQASVGDSRHDGFGRTGSQATTSICVRSNSRYWRDCDHSPGAWKKGGTFGNQNHVYRTYRYGKKNMTRHDMIVGRKVYFCFGMLTISSSVCVSFLGIWCSRGSSALRFHFPLERTRPSRRPLSIATGNPLFVSQHGQGT